MSRLLRGALLSGALLYLSVFLHEVGHLIPALAFGIDAHLTPGAVEFSDRHVPGVQMVWISLPALVVSAALAVGLTLLARNHRDSDGVVANSIRIAAALNVGLILAYLIIPAPAGTGGTDFQKIFDVLGVPDPARVAVSLVGVALYVGLASAFFRMVGPVVPLGAREVRSPVRSAIHRWITRVVVGVVIVAVGFAEADAWHGGDIGYKILILATYFGGIVLGLIGIRWSSSALSRLLALRVVAPGALGIVLVGVVAAFFDGWGIALPLCIGPGFALLAIMFAARDEPTTGSVTP